MRRWAKWFAALRHTLGAWIGSSAGMLVIGLLEFIFLGVLFWYDFLGWK